MNTRPVKLSLSLAFALATTGCVGDYLGHDSAENEAPAASSPDQSDTTDVNDADHKFGDANADAEPPPALDVAPDTTGTLSESDDATAPVSEPDGSLVEAAVLPERADCLTFYTAEEGAGSQFEGELQAATSAPRIVFLNRRGGRYTPGRNDSAANTSSIPDRVVQVPAYEGTDADWQRVVSCVKQQFADYNLRITDQDPGNVAHIEAVVGGGPETLDLNPNVGGISPFNCGVIERSIVYVFSRVLRSVQSECEVIAHEVGHSLGLEHEYLCEDPMTYLNGCGAKSFQNRSASCGTYSPTTCQCGRPTQNTVQKLLANVGPASVDTPDDSAPNPPPASDAAPRVTVVSPANGATLRGNTNLNIVVDATDDRGIADVRLLWEFQGTRIISCKDAVAPVTCTVSGNRRTFTLPVGTGPRAFTAEAVDTSQQVARSARITLNLTDNTVDRAPAIAITSPASGARFARGGLIPLRLTASDDRAVREVTLLWEGPTSRQTFRVERISGNTYGVNLRLSANAPLGARTLTVRAVDDAGQSSPSASVTVQVVR